MKTARILVLRGGAIGDFVMTLPALGALRARWPGGYIELLGYPHIAALAAAGGLVDRVISLDRASVARLFVPEEPLPAEVADHVRSFDVIVSYLYDPDEAVSRSLARAGAREVIVGSPRVTSENAALHLMRPLGSLAIFPEGEPYPRLELPPEAAAAGRARLGAPGERIVAVHPGSGSPRKNWPLERFVELAGRLAADGWSPRFIVGEADAEIERGLASVPGVRLLPRSDLVGLAAMLAACRGYAGNDSGVTHVAAAVGIPVVALFGPSDPNLWASRAPRVRVVRAAEPTPESLATVSVEPVLAALADAMAS